MDRGKRQVKGSNSNSKIYLDLKDIIRENALQFLPAKALFKCTSVCRDWKLMISSPFFAHSQSFSFRGFSGIFCQNVNEPPKFFPLDANAHGVPDPSLSFLPVPVVIRCASNGLLCCQDSEKAYYVCNPATKQWKKLPQPEGDHGDDPAIVLIFEPSLLGFDAEYQLVCGFKSDVDVLEFEIYSSVKGSWRISGEISFGQWKLNPRSGVYANGVVYWETNMYYIFGFDLTKERSISIPRRNYLGVLNGKLCSFSFLRGDLSIEVLSNSHTNTMAMNSRETGWKKLRQVKFGGFSEERNGGSSAADDKTSILQVQMNGRDGVGKRRDSVLFSNQDMVVLKTENRVIALDLRTNASTVLMTSKIAFNDDTRVISYINSLISL